MDVIGDWGQLDLQTGDSSTVELGTLVLRVERLPRELQIHVRRDGDAPEDAEVTRWKISSGGTLHLEPALPDRLLVVSPEKQFNLGPHAEARVYVRLPLQARVIVRESESPDIVLVEAPSLILSDTWWGSFTEGELGYWLTTRARTEVTAELFEPHLAMSPFQFLNESDEALPIARFAVRANHLTLFTDKGRIWTDEVSVRYEAKDEGSEIEYRGRSPKELPAGRKLADPDVAPPKGLRAITFSKLRSLSSFGS